MKHFLVISLLSIAFIATAQEKSIKPNYTSGVEYTLIDPAFETDNPEQVIVYEFFGYKCPHCSTFQPYMNAWHEKLPKHVKLVRIPMIFQAGWDILAQAYYTAETMGIIEKTHQPMFDAIHKQRKRFRNIEEIADWYAENFKVDKKAFLATANSFMIDSKLRQSNSLMKKLQVTSTPALNVNGKYKLNGKELAGRNALLELATYLSNQEGNRMGLIK